MSLDLLYSIRRYIELQSQTEPSPDLSYLSDSMLVWSRADKFNYLPPTRVFFYQVFFLQSAAAALT